MSATQSAWPRGIYSTEQVRAFDRFAIATLGIAGFELMRRAGEAALELLQDKWPDAECVGIYCGAGNNAGDGYVLAALARTAGLRVHCWAVADPDTLAGEAAQAVAMARAAHVPVYPFASAREAPREDLLVDALLGTGLTRPVEGVFAAAVQHINGAGLPVLALDIPSGLDGDTGRIHGVAVRADATVSFVALKSGLFLGDGPELVGELAFCALELPEEVFTGVPPVLRRIPEELPGQILQKRSRISHKGMNGKVLIVGGSGGMGGAARLAAEAALRVGAGLVRAAVAAESVATVMAGRPEIMACAVASADALADLCADATVIVVGPGLSQTDWGAGLASTILESDKPLVVDADALNYLADHPARRDDWVLTPHPGEAARLLGCSGAEVQAGRAEAAARIARRYGGIAVLKGACSLVAHAGDATGVAISVCDRGNPGMASGGMGDVLAGVLGGLIAQFGMSPELVECGVLVHALAGDDAARSGERGLLATDLMAHLRRRVNPA